MNENLKNLLLEKSHEIGFSMMRICAPSDIPRAASKLNSFLKKNHHGSMSWMAERIEWRGNPASLWPNAKSIIMLADNYSPNHDPLHILNHRNRGAISVYAQNKDYHELVKKKLKKLGRWLIQQENSTQIKVFVDTAPVMEKPLGAAAGLGWQGKHTNLVSRDLGSWFFLGAIFTTLDLPKDTGEEDHCGSCSACLDICPTSAFPAPYELDARKCISYLTKLYPFVDPLSFAIAQSAASLTTGSKSSCNFLALSINFTLPELPIAYNTFLTKRFLPILLIGLFENNFRNELSSKVTNSDNLGAFNSVLA
ncbi:tRNA epoxyqueuosine(34) reductase QueG [Amylibacter sp.]|nr:tRNA epoxyqueuosine(34) reductase QueG [Amylibacter sp.]